MGYSSIYLFITWLVTTFIYTIGTSDGSNGGWKLDGERSIALEGPCTVERVDANMLTQELFLEKYANSRPVIIYNYERNKLFKKRCERSQMLEEWCTAKVVLNSANTYSYKRVDSNFGEYVNSILKPQNIDVPGNETLYLFGDIDQELWKPLLKDYKLPPWNLPYYEPALSFGIAGAGTGVPFHFHGPGFGEVIHGSKRWFLLPYEQRPDFNPDKTTLKWYTEDYPKLSEKERPLECLLKAGELLYFPDKWWHATLNAETFENLRANSSNMFRALYKSRKTDDILRTVLPDPTDSGLADEVMIVCVSSPLYAEYLDSLIDDFITVRFDVIRKIRRHLSDDDVADWFRIADCNESDSETAAQYTNGYSDIFLLSRVNAIYVAERLAELHNAHSFAKCGKNAIYVSPNLVEAYRDIRFHFPKFAVKLREQMGGDALEEARAYARTRLMDPLSEQLATLQLSRDDERRRQRKKRGSTKVDPQTRAHAYY